MVIYPETHTVVHRIASHSIIAMIALQGRDGRDIGRALADAESAATPRGHDDATTHSASDESNGAGGAAATAPLRGEPSRVETGVEALGKKASVREPSRCPVFHAHFDTQECCPVATMCAWGEGGVVFLTVTHSLDLLSQVVFSRHLTG